MSGLADEIRGGDEEQNFSLHRASTCGNQSRGIQCGGCDRTTLVVTS